jgi:hypothetical protein
MEVNGEFDAHWLLYPQEKTPRIVFYRSICWPQNFPLWCGGEKIPYLSAGIRNGTSGRSLSLYQNEISDIKLKHIELIQYSDLLIFFYVFHLVSLFYLSKYIC